MRHIYGLTKDSGEMELFLPNLEQIGNPVFSDSNK
jgi:hypothetical protein